MATLVTGGRSLNFLESLAQLTVSSMPVPGSTGQRHAHHVSYVVGMVDQVSDDAALGFAEAFYDAIGAGRSIDAFRGSQ
ncbi:MAG: hypothetical protein R2867_08530 [Caldilineaceae bacterium]